MRFMCIVMSSEALAPSPKLLEGMHKLREREIKAGRMLDDGGLMEPALKTYHLLPSVRGDLLDKLGRHEEARAEFEAAAALAGNKREQLLLKRRAARAAAAAVSSVAM